ncbi:shikimate kinase [Marinicauda salina]|uniref:Shikimate kinase n=1 Tax=Marinicauda salina TaxID=2135793 RepID=A0A2U2BS13_9PROT|nr:shikimate kinase [Marinicauda salina]PWE16813.1 shikimate kinase [Marinicauda salina]
MNATDPLDALERTIVLVGLMGAGKTTVGRRLARRLGRPFKDADAEIERAAGRSVPDIFADFGESAFRDGERKVIARLLEEEPPMVLAVGGGAFVDPDTRRLVKDEAVSVWLRAELPVLMERVSRRDTRPLLHNEDPEAVMARLMEERAPAYGEADLAVDSASGSHEKTVEAIVAALRDHLAGTAPS